MDGIIVINKPKGYTSHDIVYKVKKITGEKVGHTGTLDPNATGVLPILIGKGTLLSKYLINHDKIYEVVLKLGEKTDTADIEGKVIEKENVNINLLEKSNIEAVLNSFLGKQMQMPPMYSAIKVNGKKLYEYARKGEKIEVQSREIEIYNIKLLGVDTNNLEIFFEVSCSKGTYIRSLCEDIASRLNTVGYMKELKRTKVGEFSIDESLTFKELEQSNNKKELLEKHLLTIDMIFNESEKIELNEKTLRLFLNGVKIKQSMRDGIYKIYNYEKQFIGTGIIENNSLKRDIIIYNK
ncbi:MAG: tRNA pseudouridine(55) synthase TruB [Clostridia bacterium]|nr:tRNA pseudouridine(55) synthase TruB [Clostridia bacterium]